MSTKTTNIFQSQRFWTFAGNVTAGVIASILVLMGQSVVEWFKAYLRDNGNILGNGAFLGTVVLGLIPIGGIWWSINEARKPTSGRSNKSTAMFIAAMAVLLLGLFLITYAAMVYQAAINTKNG